MNNDTTVYHNSDEKASGKRGRPRSDDAKQAILEAAVGLLVERGYAGMSIEAVAEASGAGKTTIYRWWKNRAELAVEAFFHATEEVLRFPETGSAREDFRQQILELARLLRGSQGAVLIAMLNGARTSPELAQALQARWLEPRRRWGVERMSRAVREGECRSGVEVAAALAVLYGPLYASLLFNQGTLDEAQVEAYLQIALAGIFL